MTKVADGLDVRVIPYEIEVNVDNGHPYYDKYFAERAVEILNKCREYSVEGIHFINFVSDTGRIKTCYRVIGMKYLTPCQSGHRRLFNSNGTAIQSHEYRQKVGLEWYDQLNKDKVYIESLNNENRTEVQNMLRAYVKHVQGEQKSQFIDYMLNTSDEMILKEIGLSLIRFLRYTVKID